MVTIKFQKGEPPLVFSDAIVLTDEEAAALSEQDIEAMKEGGLSPVPGLSGANGLSLGDGLVGNL